MIRIIKLKAIRKNIVLSSILLLGVIFRIAVASHFPPSADEAHNILISRNNNLALITKAMSSSHPPLYFWLLHAWQILFHNLFAVRLLSIIISFMTILATYLIGKRLLGRKVGYLTAFLVSVSPSLIYFGSIARMYSLAILLSTLMIYLYVKKIRDKKSIIYFSVITLLALYIHYYFVILVLALNIHQLIVSIKTKKINTKWIVVNLIIFICSLPLIYLVLSSEKTIALPIVTIYKLPLFLLTTILPWDLIQNLSSRISRAQFENILVQGIILVIFMLALARFYSKVKNKIVNTLLFIFFSSPLIILGISYFFGSIYGIRSFIIFSPCLYLTAGYFITIQKKFLRFASVLAVVITSTAFFTSTDLSLPTSYLYSIARENDVVVYNEPSFYFQTKIIDVAGTHLLVYPTYLTQSALEALDIDINSPQELPKDRRIWYFRQNTHWPPYEKMADELETYLANNYQEQERSTQRDSQIILYQ